jgi:ribosomal protein S18 acetylase RimI-like enzyme
MHPIRIATPSDAASLATLAEESFRETFSRMNTVEDMNLHCRTSYSEAIQSAEISDSNMVTLVCEDGGGLVAFAQVRWSKAPACVSAKNPGEIRRLYAAKPWHGKGTAQDMMESCIKEMTKRESDVVWLGVWERNSRAISFYKKSGFTEVGSHIFPLGTDPQRDIIMVRPIPTGTPCV